MYLLSMCNNDDKHYPFQICLINQGFFYTSTCIAFVLIAHYASMKNTISLFYSFLIVNETNKSLNMILLIYKTLMNTCTVYTDAEKCSAFIQYQPNLIL